MVTGVDDPVVLPDQLLAGIFRNLAELVIHIGDASLGIRRGHDGMRIERLFLVLQDLFRFPPGRDIADQAIVRNQSAPLVMMENDRIFHPANVAVLADNAVLDRINVACQKVLTDGEIR